MQEFFVDRDERGQRLDKYLRRRLPLAPSSFIYKMLRKKNITLQGKKADGSEKVETGDRVVLFLSDETIAKFSFPDEHMDTKNREREKEADTAYHRLTPLLGPSPVLYEDENILIIRKPKGILSQKAAPSDLSMNEWLRGYLQQKGETGNFSPAVCNRLDRNTGGILLCARSLQGSRDLSALIRDRKIINTYTMAVHREAGQDRCRTRQGPDQKSGSDCGRGRYAGCDCLSSDTNRQTGHSHGSGSDHRAFPPAPRPYGIDRTSDRRRSPLWRSGSGQAPSFPFFPSGTFTCSVLFPGRTAFVVHLCYLPQGG